MSGHPIAAKLSTRCRIVGACRALWLSPRTTSLPLPIQRYDEPLFPFGKAVIKATQDVIAAYVFDLVAYMRSGAAGVIALERTLALVDKDTLRILHGPFGDTCFLEILDITAFAADAITLTDPPDQQEQWGNQAGCFVVRYGAFEPGATPATYGVYWPDHSVFTVADAQSGHVIELRSIGEASALAGSSDDFVEKLKKAVRA